MPHIGHAAIRNRGTIGGSIAFADPAAELPACLLALGGEVEIAGAKGKRTVKADDFFKGLFETALGPADVLTAIRVPAATKDTRVGFAEFARRHGDYAMVGLAASAKADGKGLSDVRLAYFGVGATPVRAKSAEAALAERRHRSGGARRSAATSIRTTTCRRTPRPRSISPACCCAASPSSSRSRGHERADRRHHAHRQRRDRRRDRRGAQDAGRFPARGACR